MALQVRANFVFTEDCIEELEFEEVCDLFEKMLQSSGYDTEILSAHFEYVNIDSDNNFENEE